MHKVSIIFHIETKEMIKDTGCYLKNQSWHSPRKEWTTSMVDIYFVELEQ